MKVYVENLPKSCSECEFNWCGRCKLTPDLIYRNCPLQSLSDYTKQVRKEVCEDIRKEFLYISGTTTILANNGWIGSRTLEKFLDQIEKGENNEQNN